jgi:hypothetical protein
MGYNVSSGSNKIFIDGNDLRMLHKALCELNQHDEWKSGGAYGGEHDSRSPRPEGFDYHPGLWYAWMKSDYHHHLHNAVAVLEAVGFDVTQNEFGDIIGLHYDNKTGCEDVFLNACAPFVRSGSYIEFMGEDGDAWRYKFVKGVMYVQRAKIQWVGATEFEPFDHGVYRSTLSKAT